MKHSLLWVAILLVIIWVVARVVLAVTSIALHLLWVLAVIAIVIWLISRVSNRT
ncbi:MAG: hydrophobic protein [Chthoniobacterales bacterium]|nr:hydrophobic protein [Chthoniobacterales bacterium]